MATLGKTGFEKWQDGINKAPTDNNWHAWDCDLRRAVDEYNQHLSSTAGYVPLDWQLIKAMAWTETGAGQAQWKTKPLQIGVSGDPGLAAFLSATEGGPLILPPQWRGRLTVGSVRTNPIHNIEAGIGYLLMRAAKFDYRSIPIDGEEVREAAVQAGGSLDKFAREYGTTVAVLRQLNPSAGPLRQGLLLKYQRASVQQVIVGWRHISTSMVAHRYNGGGDPNYAKKLDYALGLIRHGKGATCER